MAAAAAAVPIRIPCTTWRYLPSLNITAHFNSRTRGYLRMTKMFQQLDSTRWNISNQTRAYLSYGCHQTEGITYAFVVMYFFGIPKTACPVLIPRPKSPRLINKGWQRQSLRCFRVAAGYPSTLRTRGRQKKLRGVNRNKQWLTRHSVTGRSSDSSSTTTTTSSRSRAAHK